MRLYVLVFMIFSTCFARRLISTDEIETLFKKAMREELSADESRTLQEVFEILYRPEHVSTRSLENNSHTRNSLDCIVCRSAFAALFDGVHKGDSDEHLTQVVTVFCTYLGIENANVCRGAIELNIPIIRYIIQTVSEATPQTFCGLVMQSATNNNICPITDPRFEWHVELPEPPVVNPPPVNVQPPLTIAVLTDAHLDPRYEAFSVGDCDEPTCCRKGQNPRSSYTYVSNVDESIIEESVVKVDGEVMLDLSVVPKIREMKRASRTRFQSPRNSPPAGYWGDYRDCDTPIWAYDDVIDTISETHRNIDVIYYIGDTIDHGVWETTYTLINDMNEHLIKKIRDNFGDGVPVIPVIGNHESQPTNQFAPTDRVTQDYLNTTWLYQALVDKWGFYLSDEAKETLLKRGDFMVQIRPGLRAISLNNNVAYKFNWWIVFDPQEAKRNLDWLVQELLDAERDGQKVHILTHIPAGVADLTYTWTREYNRIVNRFSETIAAEFNGHTHSDEFKIFYNEEGAPINVAWGGGSATTYSNYNLNYKIATFDTVTFEPTTIVNYVYNLTEANLTPHRRPHWFELYNMTNNFELSDLSAASMGGLVHRMVTNEKHLLDIYSAFVSKLSDMRWPGCITNVNCKLDNLCKTVVTVLWDREKCEELRGLYLSSQ